MTGALNIFKYIFFKQSIIAHILPLAQILFFTIASKGQLYTVFHLLLQKSSEGFQTLRLYVEYERCTHRNKQYKSR